MDIDRSDYLKAVIASCSVKGGSIGTERIIAMLQVVKDQLVVEEKGIYNIENFLNARRLMYWQVYLHKTSVSAERLLVNIIRRAQYLAASGESIPASESLSIFLQHHYSLEDFSEKKEILEAFGSLDDFDVWGAIKQWQSHRDQVLSQLCTMLLRRKLFQIRLSSDPIRKTDVEKKNPSGADGLSGAGTCAAYLFPVVRFSKPISPKKFDSVSLIRRAN